MSKVIKRGYSFGLEKSRYLELRYFCLQYNLKKQTIIKLSYLKSITNHEGTGSSTKAQAGDEGERRLQLTKLKNDIEMIDCAATEAAGDLSKYILKSVTEDLGYNYLGIVPCGERQFYQYKREFFKSLDKMK